MSHIALPVSMADIASAVGNHYSPYESKELVLLVNQYIGDTAFTEDLIRELQESLKEEM